MKEGRSAGEGRRENEEGEGENEEEREMWRVTQERWNEEMDIMKKRKEI